MISIYEVIFIGFILIAVFMQARSASRLRAKMKERANKDFKEGNELSLKELEDRLGELELMYEDLEETYWAHVSVLVGIASYFYWHVWYVSVLLAVVLGFVGAKYLSLKPFTTGIPDG